MPDKKTEPIDCPHCFEPMDIRTMEVECCEVEFDLCFICDGVYLDGGELLRITDNKPLDCWLHSDVADKPPGELKCPRCSEKMVTDRVGDVELDLCPKCKGVWFDGGELDEVKSMKPGDFKEIPHDKRAEKYDGEILEARKKPIRGFFRRLLGK